MEINYVTLVRQLHHILQESCKKLQVKGMCMCVCERERDRRERDGEMERQRDKDRDRQILLLARILLFIFVNKRQNGFVELLAMWSLPLVFLSTSLP